MSRAESRRTFRGGIPLANAAASLVVASMFSAVIVAEGVGDGVVSLLGWGVFLVPIVIRTWFAWRTVFGSRVEVQGGRISVVNPTRRTEMDARNVVVHPTSGSLPWASRVVIVDPSGSGASTFIAAAALGSKLPFRPDVEREFLDAASGSGARIGRTLSARDWLRLRRGGVVSAD